MSSIDDPIAATKLQYQPSVDPVMDMVAAVAGPVTPLAGVVAAIRGHFSRASAEERTRALLEVFEDTLRDHERVLRSQGRAIESIEARLSSPDFLLPLAEAVNETIRTTSIQQITRFGLILARSTSRGDEPTETAAIIRDVARLTALDLAALSILYRVQRDIVGENSVPTDPNPYTERLSAVLAAVDQAQIPRDDFYARASRLSGFGLAIEVQRNPGRQGPGEHCFRITARGVTVLDLISDQKAAA